MTVLKEIVNAELAKRVQGPETPKRMTAGNDHESAIVTVIEAGLMKLPNVMTPGLPETPLPVAAFTAQAVILPRGHQLPTDGETDVNEMMDVALEAVVAAVVLLVKGFHYLHRLLHCQEIDLLTDGVVPALAEVTIGPEIVAIATVREEVVEEIETKSEIAAIGAEIVTETADGTGETVQM